VLPLLLSGLAWTPGRGSDAGQQRQEGSKKNDVAQKRARRGARASASAAQPFPALSPNHWGPGALGLGRPEPRPSPAAPRRSRLLLYSQSTRPARATTSPARQHLPRPRAPPGLTDPRTRPSRRVRGARAAHAHAARRRPETLHPCPLGSRDRPSAQQNSPRRTESFSRTGSRGPVAAGGSVASRASCLLWLCR
jgi:hypothetical protein